jgi:hypothetical protein
MDLKDLWQLGEILKEILDYFDYKMRKVIVNLQKLGEEEE